MNSSPLSCSCPSCGIPTPVPLATSDRPLTCGGCGRIFTLRDVLTATSGVGQSPVPAASVPSQRTVRRSRLLWLILAILVAGAGWWLLQVPDVKDARSALRGFCAPLPTASSAYPRAVKAIRNRAWLASCLSQPEGPEAFIDLHDASFDTELAIDGSRLRQLLEPLQGLAFIPRLSLWAEPGMREQLELGAAPTAETMLASGLRTVTLAEVRQRLDAGLGNPITAQAVLDLVAGRPADEAPALGRRMLIEGEFPERLLLREFRGRAGIRLVDDGRPPYRNETSAYSGILLRCTGPGWPLATRVLCLHLSND